MNYLTATAWIKDEASYLSEWIEYHIIQGFDKFIFYDNNSTDNTKDVLKPYVDDGIVEHRFYPPGIVSRKNFWVIKHTIDELADKTKWLFHHSIDEYFIRTKDDKTVAEFLKDYEECSGVAIPWVFYGSNGHKTRTEGLVIDRFTRYWNDPNRHVKTIIQPAKTIDCCGNPHVYSYRDGHAVYSNKQLHNQSGMHNGAVNNDPYLLEDMRINHYIVMSREEFDIKMNKGLLDNSNESRRNEAESYWQWHDDFDKETFFSGEILKFSDQVKDKILKRFKK